MYPQLKATFKFKKSSKSNKNLAENSSGSLTTSSSSSSSLILNANEQHAPQTMPLQNIKNKKKPAVVVSSHSKGKVVIANHFFKPVNVDTDLTLEKGKEYVVLSEEVDGCPGWWRVKNKYGDVGLIPSNYVEEKSRQSLSQFHWFLPELDRESAERLLRADGREGVFVVRFSSSQDLFTISLLVKSGRHSEVKHYLMRRSENGESYYLSEHHLFNSIEELIHYHRHDAGSLAVRLKHVPSQSSNKNANYKLNRLCLYGDKSWEIRVSELSLLEELGSGQFGVVRRGKWVKVIEDSEGRRKSSSVDVAVKLMKEGTMSEQDFVREAKVMTKLKHPNLVQLFGLCIEHRPICIVTEFMKYGSLLSFLRARSKHLSQNPAVLLEMCLQVCEGMAYLEAKNYIHRDLAARNCLVSEGHVVKVADFGLTRFVADSNEYTSSSGTKFPIKWAPPEVLWFTKFSSKSDVWAFGVLMWEVFTTGQMPYGRATNAQVVEQIRNGKRLERPRICPRDVYSVMEVAWHEQAENRPSFSQLNNKLKQLLDVRP